MDANLKDAKRGGAIGFIHTIEGYLKHRHSKYVNSQWAVVFYAIRCGESLSAYEYARTHDLHTDVVTAIQYYSKNIQLTGKIQESLSSYLNTEFSSPKFDKYKIFTLSILTKYSNIPKLEKLAIQDWLWLYLQFVDTPKLDDKGKLQVILPDLNQSDEVLRGQVLLISGLFEDAAKWFLDRKENIRDNLHIVLALYLSGLIKSNELIDPLIRYYDFICNLKNQNEENKEIVELKKRFL